MVTIKPKMSVWDKKITTWRQKNGSIKRNGAKMRYSKAEFEKSLVYQRISRKFHYFRISKKTTLKSLIFFKPCSKTNCLWCERKNMRRSVPHGVSRKSATTSKTKSALWRKPTKSWLKKIAHYQGKLAQKNVKNKLKIVGYGPSL